jgi:putative redox protein
MANSGTKAELLPKARRPREGAENIWHEFWKLRQPRPVGSGIRARVILARPQTGGRRFSVETGSGHSFQIDDTEGNGGPQPIELVAAALAGCTASDVITILRHQKNQQVTGYEVNMEADQAERPPHPFVLVSIHYIVTGKGIDPAAVNEAIRMSEEKYCAVQAMLRHSAAITATFELIDDTDRHRISIDTVRGEVSRAEKGDPQ